MNKPLFTGELTPTPPFDFSKSLQFVGEFKPTRGEQIIVNQSMTKAVMFAGQAVAFRVWASGSVDKPILHYEIYTNSASSDSLATIQAQIVDRIAFFLSLHDDLSSFYDLARNDPAFAPIVQRLYGYHQVKFLTPFENGCWAVLTQRNPIPLAAKMKRSLVERYSQSIEVQGETLWPFPSPSDMATASVDELESLIANRQKAEYLRHVITAFDGVDEQWLRHAPAADVEQWLRAIRGFGPFATAFVLLRGLGRMDTAMPSIKQFSQAVEKVYNAGKALTELEINRIAAGYGPWQGYWMHYLRAAG